MANPKDAAAQNGPATQGTLPTGQVPAAAESAEDRLARAELMVERMMQVSEKQTAIINRLLEEKADAPAPVYAEQPAIKLQLPDRTDIRKRNRDRICSHCGHRNPRHRTNCTNCSAPMFLEK